MLFHVEEAGIQTGGKTAQTEVFTHAGSGSENADVPDVLKIVQTVCHLGKVMGNKVIFFSTVVCQKG